MTLKTQFPTFSLTQRFPESGRLFIAPGEDRDDWNWGLSFQSAFRIGTVESRRHALSQPFGCDT